MDHPKSFSASDACSCCRWFSCACIAANLDESDAAVAADAADASSHGMVENKSLYIPLWCFC